MVEIIELECPGCGAPITRETTKCIYCHKEMIIKHDDRSCHAQHYEVHVGSNSQITTLFQMTN